MKTDNKLSFITRFLVFCSGATIALIRKCPLFEVNKYASIGATVLITAFLSILSSFFAFSLIFQSVYLSLSLALLWGLIIFNLDRYIISTMRSNSSKGQEFIKSIPRIIIAILIAVVVSKPLEVKLFEKEISEYLKKEKIDLAYGVKEKYVDDLIDIENKKEKQQAVFNDKVAIRDQFYEDYKCECTGTCGTNLRGYGKECERRKERYELSLAEMNVARLKNDSILKYLAFKEAGINKLIENEMKIISNIKGYGLFDRVRALNNLDQMSSYFILLIFVMIETAPILSKLLTQKGPYDNLVLETEIMYETDYLKKIDDYGHEREKNKRLKEMSTNLEIKSKESEIRNILKSDAYKRYEKMKSEIDSKNINS